MFYKKRFTKNRLLLATADGFLMGGI